MMELITYFLLGLIFSGIGLYVGKLLAKINFEKEKTSLEKEKSTLEERILLSQQSKETVENNYTNLQIEVKKNQQEKENLLQKNSIQDSEIKYLQKKLEEHQKEVENLQKKFTNDFEVLANKILRISFLTNKNGTARQRKQGAKKQAFRFLVACESH